jgi:hypothetical protein
MVATIAAGLLPPPPERPCGQLRPFVYAGAFLEIFQCRYARAIMRGIIQDDPHSRGLTGNHNKSFA